MLAGLDLGATLHKVALARDATLADLELATFPAGDAALAFVRARRPARAAVAGGRANVAATSLTPVPTVVVPEFDAWARGAARLAVRHATPLDEPYLLVSLGTGTSILLVAEGRATRVGGTALGGGTLTGLGALLLGVERFDEITSLAARGCRGEVDLLLGDVYPQIPIPDFTAAHFGKLRSRRPEDVAHALVGLVGETVALIAAAQATARGVSCVVYAGSTLGENPALVRIVTEMTTYFGPRVVLLPDGAYGGAVGCLCAAASS
jgi:type II pantothenate kinase